MDRPTNPPGLEWGQTKEQASPAAAVLQDQPRRIGRYRVERVLGKGGFGLVYLAHDEQLQRPVAIKVPHRRLVARPEDAEAYLTEARTVANLDHPNIVPVYDVGSTEDFPCFVVSKYIDGTDLATRLKQSRPVVARSGGTGGDGGRGAALRPQARAGASGHQARQHPARQERQAVRGRFRAGLAGAGRRQGATLRRDARLHESRAGPWRRASGRWPQRHFQPGRGLLRTADRAATVSWRTRRRNCWSRSRASRPARPGRCDDTHPEGTGTHLPEGAVEAGLGAVHDGQGHGRRPAALAAVRRAEAAVLPRSARTPPTSRRTGIAGGTRPGQRRFPELCLSRQGSRFPPLSASGRTGHRLLDRPTRRDSRSRLRRSHHPGD